MKVFIFNMAESRSRKRIIFDNYEQNKKKMRAEESAMVYGGKSAKRVYKHDDRSDDVRKKARRERFRNFRRGNTSNYVNRVNVLQVKMTKVNLKILLRRKN